MSRAGFKRLADLLDTSVTARLTQDRPALLPGQGVQRDREQQSAAAPLLIYGVTYLKGCFRPSVFSHYVTYDFLRLIVGGWHVVDGGWWKGRTCNERTLATTTGSYRGVGPLP